MPPETDSRVTVAVITHNRRAELARTLDRLEDLPERPAVIVVDNGSADGSAAYVRWHYPAVTLITARTNLGAVGRNLALRRVTTPYVAFSDDDTWWDPGSLTLAADTLDAHPDVAAVTARIVVEPSGHDDPIMPELAAPRCRDGLGCRVPRCSASWPARPCCGPTPSGRRAASRPGCGLAARRNCSAPIFSASATTSATCPRRPCITRHRRPGTRPGGASSASGTRSGSPGCAAQPARLAADRRAGRHGAARRGVGGRFRRCRARPALGAAGTPTGGTRP